jgi:hypothetical protein
MCSSHRDEMTHFTLPCELGDLVLSHLHTPDLLRLRSTSRQARALVDACPHWAALERALNATNSYNRDEDGGPFVLLSDDELVALSPAESKAYEDLLQHRFAENPAAADPRIQPTYAALGPAARCRLLAPFARMCVRRLQTHFGLRAAAEVAGDSWTGEGGWTPREWGELQPGADQYEAESRHFAQLWACYGQHRTIGYGVYGCKRWCLLLTLAEMGLAQLDLMYEFDGPYWWRNDDNDDGISVADGSSLSNAVAGEGTLFDHQPFQPGGAWAGLVPGSDAHILALASAAPPAECQRLMQLCGDALGARFDVMAEARALVPQLLADAAIIAPLPDWRDGEEDEEDDDDDEEEEEG